MATVSAGLDAGVDGLFYTRTGVAPDHDDGDFPEGEYRKGLVVIKRP
jgi:hypothetical protein